MPLRGAGCVYDYRGCKLDAQEGKHPDSYVYGLKRVYIPGYAPGGLDGQRITQKAIQRRILILRMIQT